MIDSRDQRDPDSTDTTLDKAFADLDANQPAEAIVAALRTLEPDCAGKPAARSRLLHARGLAMNRMSLPGEALGDLYEARSILESLGDHAGAAAVWRSIGLVQSWRGNGREAALALLHTIADGFGRLELVASGLIEAGRLNMEIGRPREALALLRRGLELGNSALPLPERRKAVLNTAQAAVACGETKIAHAALADLDGPGGDAPEAPPLPPRLAHLAAIERCRLALRDGDPAAARARLDRAGALLPADQTAFEHIEYREAQADILLAGGQVASALPHIRAVIARCAADDLAGREVVARLKEAVALDALSDREGAERTLAAALRRATSHDLSGHADRVREKLAEWGASPQAWAPGLMPALLRQGAEGRFVRRRPLGAGGFGSVSSAYDLETGAEVALKRLDIAKTYDVAQRTERLDGARREVEAASRIQHPGVGQVYGLIDGGDGDVVLVREFVSGPTLRERMEQSLPLAQKLAILTHIAHALVAIHLAGVIHRDLKPENVVLRDGTYPVVIDFGISLAGPGRSDADALRTPAYAAPEQLAGKRVDRRADLYSFGVLGYELLSGARLTRPGLVARLRAAHRQRAELAAHAVPGPVIDLVVALLRSARWRRPASAREVAVSLQNAIAGLAAAPPPSKEDAPSAS